MSVSIQADEIVARLGAELIEGIERLFPEQIGRGASGSAVEQPVVDIPSAFDDKARPVEAAGDGYIQLPKINLDRSEMIQPAVK